MDLNTALGLVDAAFAEGRRLNAAPLSIVVLDSGGNVVACAREDGAGIARLHLAYGKAWGSLGLGFGSRTLAERVDKSPPFFAAAAALLDGRLLPAPGGVVVLEGTSVYGAVGVSGDAGDIDETCALKGVQSLGFTAKT